MEILPADAGVTVGFTVRTDVFDGPLDLLLHLVKRDGISLARLEVARIADAYLTYLDGMRALDLAIAADWLVMAATLVHLKALELLPRPPAILAEEEQDPRDALLEQLQAYEIAKLGASALDAQLLVGRDVFVREGIEPPQADRPFVSPVDVFGLLDILHDVLARGRAPDPIVRLGGSGPNIGACCRRVLGALGGKGGRFALQPLLLTLPTRAERVVTFVAVLEMARLAWVDVDQEAHLAPIEVLQLVESESIDLAKVTGVEMGPGDQLVLPIGGDR